MWGEKCWEDSGALLSQQIWSDGRVRRLGQKVSPGVYKGLRPF